MKIVIDALAATKYSGGMRLHALEVIRAWREQYPEDELIVVADRQLSAEFSGDDQIRFRAWPAESIVSRAPGQLFYTAFIRAQERADYLISLSPIVSPITARRRSVCFQHDWRHKKNSHEFSRVQRAYRTLWSLSARRAGLNVCISEKTLQETLQIAPRARAVVVENGRDHARRWGMTRSPRVPRTIVTFGHHNNKRPELVIDAFAMLPPELRDLAELVVLGSRGNYRDELAARADSLGIGTRVRFPGFVSDDEYRATVAGAAAVVMASSDEGFGLPLAEAEFFGVPAVTTTDSGVADLFPTAYAAAPSPDRLAESLATTLKEPPTPAATVPWGWRDTATEVRKALESGITNT